MSMNGVSAMIRCALFLEDTLGMDVLNIGRSALDRKDSCTLEACGRHLSYVILLDGGWVFSLGYAIRFTKRTGIASKRG
jgi:hypothetical protein